MELTVTPKHSRLTSFIVILTALMIIGAWTFFTQAGLRGKTDAVGYAICHRIDERSFHAFGKALPLCARCTGIYLGVVTGLGVFAASGRGKAAYLPNWRVGVVLGLFVVVMGIDGFNSYFSLFPGYKPIYQSQNWLRLVTGVFCGLTLISIVFPIYNQSIWSDGGQASAPIRNFKELAGLCFLAALMIALVLAQNATILLTLGILSALGVVSVLTMVMTVMVVTGMQTFRSYTSYRELSLPLLAGLTLAIALIGAIDFARYNLTGTWNGFVF